MWRHNFVDCIVNRARNNYDNNKVVLIIIITMIYNSNNNNNCARKTYDVTQLMLIQCGLPTHSVIETSETSLAKYYFLFTFSFLCSHQLVKIIYINIV